MNDQDGIRLLYDAFFAIAESYTSMSYVDVADQKTYPIRYDSYSERYKDVMETHPVFGDVLGQYVKDTVYRDDAAAVMRFADIDYVTEKLKEENPLLHVYRTIHNDRVIYYRLKVVPIEEGKRLVFGFENIDKEYRRQLEIKASNERSMLLLDGLSREYMSVWFIDGRSRKVTMIRNNGTEAENGEAVRIGNMMVDYHFSMQKYFGKFVRPEDFDHLMEATSYDSLVKNAGDNDLYCINYLRVEPDGNSHHFQVCYAKITDEAGTADFVMGFRNIDSAVEK